MIEILPDHKTSCCGCRACAQACPVSCITMVEDDEGFLYPSVDKDACIGCGRCERVCPVIHDRTVDVEKDPEPPRTIGGYHNDEAVRMDSSSGGAFTLFARHILAQGGVVCGCALDDRQRPAHICVTDESDLTRLRGSKYVQSDTKESFREVKAYLKAGRPVFFVGTPCQVAGLRSFLGKPDDKLLTCDFICHGTPSPKVFRDYVASLESGGHGRVESFRFRNKDRAWSSSGLQMGTKITYADGTVERKAPAFRDAYMNGFLGDLYLRPICYECPFKRLPKYYADITIADFWGVDKVCPELNDGKGTSLVLLHSAHAQEVFEAVKDDFTFRDCDFARSLAKNPPLLKSSEPNPHRARFFGDYRRKGYGSVERTYLTALRWATHRGMKALRAILRKLLRR